MNPFVMCIFNLVVCTETISKHLPNNTLCCRSVIDFVIARQKYRVFMSSKVGKIIMYSFPT